MIGALETLSASLRNLGLVTMRRTAMYDMKNLAKLKLIEANAP